MSTSLESTALATFQQHRRAVHAWAYRVLGNHHDAMDVAQEVFLKWVEQVQIVEPAAARAWLRTVTMNKAIDVIRSRRRAAETGEVALRMTGVEDSRTEREELRQAIASALESLSEQQRAVLVAKVYDGLTFAQVAQELDIAVPTAKTHYMRALAAVREVIPEAWNPKGDKP